MAMCRHLQNADDEKVRKRWQSCQFALEEESRAVREKEKRKTSSATPYKKIMAKLFDSEALKGSPLTAKELGSGQNCQGGGWGNPSRTPKMHHLPESFHSCRVMEVVSFTLPECCSI